jgi:hypothetical protein
LEAAWREDEVLVNELLVAAGFMRILEAGHRAGAEMEELRVPLLDERIGDNLLLDSVELPYARIVDEGT